MNTTSLTHHTVAPRLILAALFTLLALLASPAMAMYAQPQSVPADRIVANLLKQLQAKLNDPDLLYKLGRVHYLAFVLQSNDVPGWGGPEDFQPIPNGLLHSYRNQLMTRHAETAVLKQWKVASVAEVAVDRRQAFRADVQKEVQRLDAANWQPAEIDDAAMMQHAEQAKQVLTRAIDTATDKAAAVLTLASLHEKVGDRVAHTMKDASAKAVLAARNDHYAQAFDGYRRAYELSIKREQSREAMPLSSTSTLVSHEAGQRMLAMLAEKKVIAENVRWTDKDDEGLKAQLRKR